MLKLFRIGPILMLVPVYVWAWGWNIGKGPHTENHDWYIVWPMYVFIAIAGIWHLALIFSQQERRMYVAYAVLHMPVFYIAWAIAVIIAERFPL